MTDLSNDGTAPLPAAGQSSTPIPPRGAFPEDLPRPGSPSTPLRRPNYWLGFVLNFFFLGSGFTYINRIGWHFGWIGIALGTGVMLGGLTVIAPAIAPLVGLGSLLVSIGTMVHYRNTYAAEFAAGFTGARLNDGLKWGVIGAHIVLGFLLQVGILAAVLIPNLLNAKTRAIDAGGNAYARQVATAAMVDALDGKAKSGPCTTTMPVSRPDYVTACTVDASDPENPQVTVTLKNGTVITQP